MRLFTLFISYLKKIKQIATTDDKGDDTPMRKLWEKLGDIPIDKDERIEEPFEHFPKGTDRYEIWHWFEDRFDIEVASLLYPGKKSMEEYHKQTLAENKSYICQFCGHDLSQAQALIGKHYNVMKFHMESHARDDLVALLEENNLMTEVVRINSKYGILKGG